MYCGVLWSSQNTIAMVSKLRLSWADKATILKECERCNISRGKKKITTASKWADSHLKIHSIPSIKTIPRILREENLILEINSSDFRNQKQVASLTHATIEHDLSVWVMSMWTGGMPWNSLTITRFIQCYLLFLTRTYYTYTPAA